MRSDDLLGDRYRLVEQLGTGGMSVVWRGFDEVLGRQVAVKLLAPRLAADRALRRRIRAEAQAAARLCHPHIATIYDYGEAVSSEEVTLPYVVMELVDGQPLASRLAGGQALPWRSAVTACTQVAAALANAHAHGVVHRDVTPGNVMLTTAGAKVVDFGISAAVGERDADANGTLLGTPTYVAPERIDGERVTPATDVYALGLLLYRALTGRRPWQADTTTQVLRAHRYAEPSPMPPIAGLPAEVTALCERCLAKNPADRPSSAQVARDLAAALGGVPAFDLDAAGSEGEPMAAAALTSPLSLSMTTDFLPTWADEPIPVRHRGRWFSATRRRAEAVLVGAVMLVSGVAWAGTAWSPGADDGGRGQALAIGGGLGAHNRACAVEHRLQHDSGRAYTASVLIKNTGSEPFQGWKLTFDLPGDQRLISGTAGEWSQSGRTVTALAGDGSAVAPGSAVQLTYSAGYRGNNPVPAAFAVDGNDCTTVIIGTSVAGETGGSGAGSGRDYGTGNKGENRGRGKGNGD